MRGSSSPPKRRRDARSRANPPRAPTGPPALTPRTSTDPPAGGLPRYASSFIGRERERAHIRQVVLSESAPLVTLTGAPGVGKSRLAVEAAGLLHDEFPDGIFFVDLSPLSDPGLVLHRIARVLRIREHPGSRLADLVVSRLRGRRLLLILDNYEHLLAAVPTLGELLNACPDVRVIVTSRAPLGLTLEREAAVLPFPLPDPSSKARLADNPAVALFVERGRAVRTDFAITEENTQAVAEICRRLDGLPLAIELAAARIKLLSPQALLARLHERFDLLASRAHDLPARHRTLGAAIAWSYNLLEPHEQAFFRRLSVFSGGARLDAIEAVCAEAGAPGGAVLEALASLIDKSLLHRTEDAGGEPRYMMLETLREFGLDRLREAREEATARDVHLRFFVALAEGGQDSIGSAQTAWLNRLEVDHDNLRAALHRGKTRGHEPGEALRLAAALWTFWHDRVHWHEGLEWLENLLASDDGEPIARMRALAGLARLLLRQRIIERGLVAAEESLVLARQIGDRRGQAFALLLKSFYIDPRFFQVGAARIERIRQSEALAQEALVLYREAGDEVGVTNALLNIGVRAIEVADYARAKTTVEEALEIARRLGAEGETALALNHLGEEARARGDFGRAEALYEESLQIRRRLGNRRDEASSLSNLGYVAAHRGDGPRALTLLGESLAIVRELGAPVHTAVILAGIGMAQRRTDRAVRLISAALALSPLHELPAADRTQVERRLDVLRARLSKEAFEAAWEEGRRMRLEDATDEALAPAKSATRAATRAAAHPRERLTRREQDVADLIAEGLSNREIGSALGITKGTAEVHVQHIMNKLGFHSRSQIAAWAVDHG